MISGEGASRDWNNRPARRSILILKVVPEVSQMVFSPSIRNIITVLNRPGAPVWGAILVWAVLGAGLAFPLEGRAQSGAAISGAAPAAPWLP